MEFAKQLRFESGIHLWQRIDSFQNTIADVARKRCNLARLQQNDALDSIKLVTSLSPVRFSSCFSDIGRKNTDVCGRGITNLDKFLPLANEQSEAA